MDASDSAYYYLYIQDDSQIYAHPDSSYLFDNCQTGDSINNMSILDISKITNMSGMFDSTGYLSPIFIPDCRSWNVDKVTKHTNFNINVLSKVTPPEWKS